MLVQSNSKQSRPQPWTMMTTELNSWRQQSLTQLTALGQQEGCMMK